MRTLIFIPATAALLAACSQPPHPPGSSLGELATSHSVGPARTCITTNSAENLRVIDPQTVAYGNGQTIWINRLAAECPALSAVNTVIVEAGTGGQYCRGDRVRGLEVGAMIPGPSCSLGDWVPYRQR